MKQIVQIDLFPVAQSNTVLLQHSLISVEQTTDIFIHFFLMSQFSEELAAMYSGLTVSYQANVFH